MLARSTYMLFFIPGDDAPGNNALTIVNPTSGAHYLNTELKDALLKQQKDIKIVLTDGNLTLKSQDVKVYLSFDCLEFKKQKDIKILQNFSNNLERRFIADFVIGEHFESDYSKYLIQLGSFYDYSYDALSAFAFLLCRDLGKLRKDCNKKVKINGINDNGIEIVRLKKHIDEINKVLLELKSLQRYITVCSNDLQAVLMRRMSAGYLERCTDDLKSFFVEINVNSFDKIANIFDRYNLLNSQYLELVKAIETNLSH